MGRLQVGGGLSTLACFFRFSRLPDLKAFLKGGEAETYRRVEIKYVRGTQATIHVFDDGKKIAERVLSGARNIEALHSIMLSLGFEKKTEEELRQDREKARRIRKRREYAMFFSKEYQRKKNLHAHLFRQDVMADNEYYLRSWVYKNKGMLYDNYDRIFKHEAITKEQILQHAKAYLMAERQT